MGESAKAPVEDFATDWDHTDPQWVKDPYPIWEDLRQRCPVAHTERYGGGWFPSTHELVSAVAKDTEHFTSRQVVVVHNRDPEMLPPRPIGGAPPITSDPPFHAIARRLLLPAFAPGPVNALEDQVRALCRRHLDELDGQSVFDAGAGYAQFVSPGVIGQMLGFPPEDEDRFREFVDVVLGEVDLASEQRRDKVGPVIEYLVAQVEDHRAHPRDDLTSFLLNAEINGEKLEDRHVLGSVILILLAGIDTTWSAIGSSLWHLASHPEDLARLVAEPDLMPVALEEFLRYYAPVTMARQVIDDVELFGVEMKALDWVLLGFPAANRDPAAFKDADRFVIDRTENRHVAFGLGIHRCIGSNLARLELRIAIEEFIARFPRFELADPDAVTWSPGQIRGPRHLPIRVLAS